MNEKYISVEKAMNAVRNAKPDRTVNTGCDGDWADAYYYNTTIIRAIESVPSADVSPVVHGQWQIIEDDILCDTWIKCSVCGNEHETAYEQDLSSYSYCPNCGAKMDLEEDG